MTSAFFYGTLMAPAILCRVIKNDGSHLQVAPAILLHFTRHAVKKDADYPAVLPCEQSRALFDRELTQDEQSVRGTLVTGLTQEDMTSLDYFEGNEYIRKEVRVYPLASLSSMSPTSPAHLLPHSIPLPDPLPEPVHCLVYIWIDRITMLSPDVWSYSAFVKEKMHRWIRSGSDSDDNDEEPEADRRIAMNSATVQVECGALNVVDQTEDMPTPTAVPSIDLPALPAGPF